MTSTPLVWADAEKMETICSYTEDWYRLEVPQAGLLSLNLTFDGGDLDLRVFDENNLLLADAASDQVPEYIAMPDLIEGQVCIFRLTVSRKARLRTP